LNVHYQRLISLVGWTLLGFVAFATLSPPWSRPELMAAEPPIVVIIEHVGALGLVGFLMFLAYPTRQPQLTNFIILAVVGLEILQLLVPGRHFRLSDLMEKLVGAGGGMLAAAWLLDILMSRGWTFQPDQEVMELIAGSAGIIILAASLVIAQNL
jgi:hypothetical protein